MEKKSVAASFIVFFLALMFAVIGASFSTFVYKNKIIEFKEIKIVKAESIQIFEDKKFKKQIDKLKLSDMKLGLKPATGEVDADTEIPSTITDEGTSEGYYETLYVKSTAPYRVIIKNIEIKTDQEMSKVQEERENIFVALKDIKNTTKSLEHDEIELVRFEQVKESQELVFLFWLGSLSGEELVGSKISFTINFELI